MGKIREKGKIRKKIRGKYEKQRKKRHQKILITIITGTSLQMQIVRKCEASVKACRTCSDEGQRDRQKQLLASASECGGG